MSKIMIKINIALLAIMVSIGFGYGQSSDMELIHSGDVAMKRGRFTEAIYYYIQVDNSPSSRAYSNSNTDEEIYYPYSLNSQEKSANSEKKSGNKVKKKSVDETQTLITNKLAKAYRLAKDYSNSEKWYAKAVENPNDKFPNAAYYYGCALINNAKYAEAKLVFEELIKKRNSKEDPISKLAEKKVKDCVYGLREGLEQRTPTIQLMQDEINSGTSSFGMMYYNGGLLFASSKEVHPYNSDIYIIKEDEDGNLSAPQRFEGEANSSEVEGAAVFSEDGQTLFFTRVDRSNPDNINIYILRNFNGNWLKPFKLGKNVNVEGYKSMMPCLGGDGKTLYFASNRPGGYGGMDIWKTKINDMGKATEPVNLGKNVNTSQDEITPFYHTGSKTLYFSTDGRVGFGGFDVFKSTFNILTDTWNTADNLGPSVNGSMDDTYFIWGEDMKDGYLTSDRETCKSCDSSEIISIHCNKIYRVNNPDFKIKIEGYVYDMESNLPVPYSEIHFKDIRGVLEDLYITTDEDGHYEATLLENNEYFIKSIKEGYFADAMVKSTMGMVRPRSILSNFYLQKISSNEIEIKGIEYDFDSANLRDKSKVILNDIVQLLKLNSNLKVEIRSHTDSRGNPDYNIDLSQRRAQNVVEYLVNRGIQRNRLIAKGMGSTQPAIIKISGLTVKLDDQYINSITDDKTKEEYYQLNRRTAFKVLNP